jgi:hypothetical protein
MWGWGALVFMRAFMAETAGERARDNRSGRRAP